MSRPAPRARPRSRGRFRGALGTACAALCCLGAALAADVPKERVVMGWVEYVTIEPWGVNLKAKLDTGAKTSSMHATGIQEFYRSGDRWVRFEIQAPGDGNGPKTYTMERPVIRGVRIKEHGGELSARPVVSLHFCLNGRRHKAQFTLADRSNFLYPVLLGRRFLEDVALVDPAETYLTGSACRREADEERVPAR